MSQQESASIPPWLNKIMTGLLRSPLHWTVSKSIMLISFSGRKSGKLYTTPISYCRTDDTVTAFTRARWSRNIAGGAPVTLRIKNVEYQGQGEIISDDKAAVAEGLRDFLRVVRFDARFYQVEFDDDGEPNWEDVQRAAGQVQMIRVQLNGS